MNTASPQESLTTDRPAPLTSPGSAYRLAGFAALAFAASVVAANSLLFGAPMPGTAVAEAAAWYDGNATRVMLATAMVALAFPALLVFAASLFELGRGVHAARPWTLVGALGAAGMVGVFSIVAAGQIGSVLLAESAGDAFTAAWIVHNAAFAINMTVLGTAFLGFSMGAYALGVTPRWMRTFGVTGASLMLATGFVNAAVADGSLLALVGFGGFLMWLFWLVTTGVRLMSMAARSARSAGPTSAA